MKLHRPALRASVVAATVFAAGPVLATAADRDVRVVNTPAERIPVAATGTVSLAAGTQVGVSNTAASPLHVVAPAVVPEVFVRSATVEFEENSNDGHAFITVPPGKRLVIEQVGASLHDVEGMTVDFTVRVSSRGGSAQFRLAAEARGNSSAPGLMNYILSAPLRAYHDGGLTELRVGAIRSDDPPGTTALVTVSGYLIDLP